MQYLALNKKISALNKLNNYLYSEEELLQNISSAKLRYFLTNTKCLLRLNKTFKQDDILLKSIEDISFVYNNKNYILKNGAILFPKVISHLKLDVKKFMHLKILSEAKKAVLDKAPNINHNNLQESLITSSVLAEELGSQLQEVAKQEFVEPEQEAEKESLKSETEQSEVKKTKKTKKIAEEIKE